MFVLTRTVIGSTVRLVPWLPLLVTGLASAVIVASRRSTDEAFPMQVASILLASAAGYALDDPAAEVLGASPVTLLRRRGHRLAVVLPPTVASWAVLLLVHDPVSGAETLAFVATFAGLLGLAVAIAGVAVRRSSHGAGGMAVGPVLFGLLLLSTTFPPRWRPLPMGDIPGGWLAIDGRWFTAAAVGLTVFLVSSRDPAARRRVGQATRSPAT